MVALIIALLEHPEQHAEVRDCLSECGHAVCVVDSFTNAILTLQEQSFDLIISDAHLENGGSVFDFLKWIKSSSAYHEIPFVIFSLKPTALAKYLAHGVQTASRTFGASKYISMDRFDPTVFAKEIAELLPPVEKEVIQTEATRKGNENGS